MPLKLIRTLNLVIMQHFEVDRLRNHIFSLHETQAKPISGCAHPYITSCQHSGPNYICLIVQHIRPSSCLCSLCSGCIEGNVRLQGSSVSTEGRVEICRSNLWGTVCESSWDAIDAAVVCIQLGLPSSGKGPLNNRTYVHAL